MSKKKKTFSAKPKALIIVGPTSSGKSALAVELARRFGGEAVSADSRQVYRGLDIGTGKVTKREMLGVPHHLLDIASPKRIVTAHEFAKKAHETIAKIHSHGKLPVIVGGTGFYIDALFGRLSFPDVPPNKALRTRFAKNSVEKLYALLKEKDPRRAKTMDTPSEKNNKVRLIRALEIAAKKRSRLPQIKDSPLYETLWIGIAPSQKILQEKIEKRLKSRVRRGMIAEAKRLHAQGVSYKRMEALGLEYRSLARLLQNKVDRKTFEQELYRDIRRYARKQIMYWKRNSSIQWFEPKQRKTIERRVAAWLKIS